MNSYGSEWCNEWATVDAASVPPRPSLALFSVSIRGSLSFWALLFLKPCNYGSLWKTALGFLHSFTCMWRESECWKLSSLYVILKQWMTGTGGCTSCFYVSSGDNFKYMLDYRVSLQDSFSSLPCASRQKHSHSKSLQTFSLLRIWPKTDTCYTFTWKCRVGYLSLKFMTEIWARDIYLRAVGL